MSDVVHLAWSGQIGGIERQLAMLARRMHEEEVGRCLVVLLDGRGTIGDDLEAEGIAVRLGCRRGWDPRGLWRLARVLRRLRPAILHLHTHSIGAHVVALAVLPRATRVYTEHFPRGVTGRSPKFRLLYWLLRRTCVRVVALGPVLATALERRGFGRDRIVTIPNAVAVEPSLPPARTTATTIGVVARLSPSKRVDLLLDALAELRRRGVECSGIVVGDGPLRAELEDHAEAGGVGDAVDFVGEQDDVVTWLDRIDVFLMTSEVEIYPTAALEAMARGVPVVAMACEGGLARLATAGGLLLPDREPTTAADAIAHLLESEDARAELRSRGWAVAREHRLEVVLPQLDELYRTAAAAAR